MTEAELDAHVRTALDSAFAMITPKPRKPRKRKTYVDVFFDNSIAGLMLRTLYACGSIDQAQFMRVYHQRCARDNPSRSSFGANFGRYVKREQMFGDRWRENDGPLRCLEQHRNFIPTMAVRRSNRNAIRWVGLTVPQMITAMDSKSLDRAENTMERIFTRDDDKESFAYLEALRAEMRARAKQVGV